MLADAVGWALLIVIDTLPPPERLAFVLHDTFAVPFEDIAAILDRSPIAARQLASRARRRVRGAPTPDTDLARQWQVVDAFFSAARDGDFEALVAVLDPEVTLRTDRGVSGSALLQGAPVAARQAVMFAGPRRVMRRVLVNGAAGAVITIDGAVVAVMGFTVRGGTIAAIDSLSDPRRLARLARLGIR